ncbi:putative HofG-like general secretion pathway protein [Crocosphaera subtropica ATCC 51142]|uniref:HofG-like general secretion pathway protein n=1 Tax=Crocosphaera subtropica (strain ATCC 51142 / BH68) TaxID=43989 RepID=B1WYW5_CROS5|nr:type IV pilin-like G/H family protein [Crocosphaera subtropica]ACB52729.1 putative HofG-like general secretion pathway protein [Crocosphaera subtropica ATCC 51142]
MIFLKLFQSVTNKPAKGFTLIELMVVILIVSVLGVIALPMTISAVGKARETEAKQILSSIGQGQQAYFFEHATFATALDSLDVTFSGQYYNFEEPLLINSTAVKHGAIGLNAQQANTREYQLGIYYNLSSFSLVLCQSSTENDVAEAPNSSNDSCIQGTRID